MGDESDGFHQSGIRKGRARRAESQKALLSMRLSLFGEVYGKQDYVPNLSGKLDSGGER